MIDQSPDCLLHLLTQPCNSQRSFSDCNLRAHACQCQAFSMPDIDWLEARESFANMDFCRFDLVFSAPDSPRIPTCQVRAPAYWVGWSRQVPVNTIIIIHLTTFLDDVDDGRMRRLSWAACRASTSAFSCFLPEPAQCVCDALSIHLMALTSCRCIKYKFHGAVTDAQIVFLLFRLLLQEHTHTLFFSDMMR